ncbi:hypothetical protein BQ8482_110791 [Mesorhizobium delmotii]|uniref:Uncharacterized protein n=1 Tax=Mesorhizobium delmotii TaxID=1631247 RepID=A0A2P9ACL4_9HYPH|nr:hypothetical protein BQ8482_110791 [Mesorhizobium delmotii]
MDAHIGRSETLNLRKAFSESRGFRGHAQGQSDRLARPGFEIAQGHSKPPMDGHGAGLQDARPAPRRIYPSFPLSCPWLPEKRSQGKGALAHGEMARLFPHMKDKTCSITTKWKSNGAAARSSSKPARLRARLTARCSPPTAKPRFSPPSFR